VSTIVPAPAAAPSTDNRDNDQWIDKAAQELAREGYRISSRSSTSVQFVKPKQWSQAGLVLFVLLPLLSVVVIGGFGVGIAFFGLLIVVLDYLFKKEKYETFTVEQIKRRYKAA
jgi:nitrate reductase NapE component